MVRMGPRPHHQLVLILLRAFGFLAPLAVAAAVTGWLAVEFHSDPATRGQMTIVLGIAAVAGMTTMALLGWSYVGWRLNRIAASLERTIANDQPIHLRETGIPAERRLARALNATS